MAEESLPTSTRSPMVTIATQDILLVGSLRVLTITVLLGLFSMVLITSTSLLISRPSLMISILLFLTTPTEWLLLNVTMRLLILNLLLPFVVLVTCSFLSLASMPLTLLLLVLLMVLGVPLLRVVIPSSPVVLVTRA